MATRIDIDYDRQFTDADLLALLGRFDATLGVLEELGVPYQNLPDMAMADYSTKGEALDDKFNQYIALLNQLKAVVQELDTLSQPIKGLNEALLRALQGLLKNKEELRMLDRITGATPRPSAGPTVPVPGP